MFALSEFNIQYQPTKVVNGQALADLITERINTNIATLSVHAWAMYFDGSACEDGCGIGVLLVLPQGVTYSFSVRLPTPCTNNLVEYEVVRRGMELLLEASVEAVEVFGDSKLVVSLLTEEYRSESESLFPLWMQCRELMTQFRYINFYWIPRSQNAEANALHRRLRVQGNLRRSRFLDTVSRTRRPESRYLQLLEGSSSGHLRGYDTRP
jgi:ribonuclease HI